MKISCMCTFKHNSLPPPPLKARFLPIKIRMFAKREGGQYYSSLKCNYLNLSLKHYYRWWGGGGCFARIVLRTKTNFTVNPVSI
jgi:hypothetical protein